MPKRKYAPRFAFQMAIAVGIVSLLPTPAWPQYFCLCIPFLLVSAVCVTHDLVVTTRVSASQSSFARSVRAARSGYIAAAIPDFHRYLVTGEGVPGVRSAPQPDDLKLSRVREVSQAINEIAAPSETVASFWSGYVFQTTHVLSPDSRATTLYRSRRSLALSGGGNTMLCRHQKSRLASPLINRVLSCCATKFRARATARSGENCVRWKTR